MSRSRLTTANRHPCLLTLDSRPSMVPVLLKGFIQSVIRSAPVRPADFTGLKYALSLQQVRISPETLYRFNTLCGFSHQPNALPSLFFQTLFTPLLGKFITASFFPVKPLGLIHTRQEVTLRRLVNLKETLDLKVVLSSVDQVEKGIAFKFHLTVFNASRPVWEGVSTFLSKTRTRSGGPKPSSREAPEMTQSIRQIRPLYFPGEAGRQYARVSLDYNPHHLSRLFARLFGFNRPIAHGMFTLCRCVAELTCEGIVPDLPLIDVSFKKPVFLPSKAFLAHTKSAGIVSFKLVAPHSGAPHIIGTIRPAN